jgi:p21-activated kinase 1
VRAHTTRDRAQSVQGKPGGVGVGVGAKPSPTSSSSDLALKPGHHAAAQQQGQTGAAPGGTREKPERAPTAPSAAVAGLPKHGGVGAPGQGQATPRRREKKHTQNDSDIVKRLQAICTDADPTRLYRNLVKIGQGCVLCGLLDLSEC